MYPTILSERQPAPADELGAISAPSVSLLYALDQKKACICIITEDGHEFEVPMSSLMWGENQITQARTFGVGDKIWVPTTPIIKSPRASEKWAPRCELAGWLTKEITGPVKRPRMRFACSNLQQIQCVESLVSKMFPHIGVKCVRSGSSQYLTFSPEDSLRINMELLGNTPEARGFPVAITRGTNLALIFLKSYLNKHAWTSISSGQTPRAGLPRSKSLLYCRLQQNVLRYAGINSRIRSESRNGVLMHRVCFDGDYNYQALRKCAPVIKGEKLPSMDRLRTPNFAAYGTIGTKYGIWSLVKISKIDIIGVLKTYRRADGRLPNDEPDGGKTN